MISFATCNCVRVSFTQNLKWVLAWCLEVKTNLQRKNKNVWKPNAATQEKKWVLVNHNYEMKNQNYAVTIMRLKGKLVIIMPSCWVVISTLNFLW